MQCSELLETRPSMLQSVFPLRTKSNACVCTLGSEISSTASYGQSYRAFPSPRYPRQPILRQAERPGPSAQVTTCTNRTTVWFTVHPSPMRLDHGSLKLVLPGGCHNYHGMICGLSYSSLMKCIRGEMERICKLPPIGAPPDC